MKASDVLLGATVGLIAYLAYKPRNSQDLFSSARSPIMQVPAQIIAEANTIKQKEEDSVQEKVSRTLPLPITKNKVSIEKVHHISHISMGKHISGFVQPVVVQAETKPIIKLVAREGFYTRLSPSFYAKMKRDGLI